ncbi:MAG: type III-B CRISPR module RAMP protein Cmr6 [Candidatus Muiribacteriota bacterium]
MTYYPLSSDLQQHAENFDKGNFSLWYRKYIPLNSISKLKPSDKDNNENNYTKLYKSKYSDISRNSKLKDILKNKHLRQMHFCSSYENQGFKTLTINAKLISPMILGLGESHPAETSMVFDHTSGLPYIPASSIKGINRFSQAVEYIIGENAIKYNDEKPDENSLIPLFFGTQEKKGDILFLDAYPADIPQLKEDIMNPHYNQYYGEGNPNKIKPPSDTENPVPIKFLAVKENAEFVFRVLYKTEKTEELSKEQVKEKITNFFKRSLKKEGIGAKTSLGYGHFEILGYTDPEHLKEGFENYLEQFLSEKEKLEKEINDFIAAVKVIDKNNQSLKDTKFEDWRSKDHLKDNEKIAQAFLPLIKKKKSGGDFTKQYLILKEILKLEEKPENINKDTSDNSEVQLTKKEQAAQKKMEQFISSGSISKKELKKYKEYKTNFPELYEKISKLPQK